MRPIPEQTPPTAPLDPYLRERAAIDALDPDPFRMLTTISRRVDGLDVRYYRQSRDESESCEQLAAQGLVQRIGLHHAVCYIAPARVAMATLEIAANRGERSPSPSPRDPMARLRAQVAEGDHDELAQVDAKAGNWLVTIIGPAARPKWLASMSAQLRLDYLAAALQRESNELGAIDHLLKLAAKQDETGKAATELRLGAATGLALRGDRSGALAVASGRLPKWGREAIELLGAYWSGEFAEALEIGERTVLAMAATRKQPALPDLAGICHILAATVAAKQPEQLAALGRLVTATKFSGRPHARDACAAIRARLSGTAAFAYPLVTRRHLNLEDWVEVYVALLHDAWLPDDGERDPHAWVPEIAEHWRERAQANGYPTIAGEFEAIAEHVGPSPSGRGLVGLYRPPEPWEAALASLEVAALQPTDGSDATRELVWEIDGMPPRYIEVTPRIRSGRQKKGKAVSIDRLSEPDYAELVTDADRRVLASFMTHTYPRGGVVVAALVGHPRVIDPDGARVEVVQGRATLRTTHVRRVTTLELEPAELVESETVVTEPEPGRMVVYSATSEIRQIARALARPGGFVVPTEGRARLAHVLSRLAALGAVEVVGDLGVTATTRESDARPVFQLGWSGGALAVRLRVVPLGAGGPALLPGAGAARLVAEVRHEGGGELCQCDRDLDQERNLALAALDACPTLSGFGDGEWQWRATSLEAALEILLELDALGEAVVVAWQAGQKLDLPRVAELSDLRIKVSSGTAWLDVDANLSVDEFTVIQFRELMRNREGGRFVALPRGQFLALSERLRQHLDKLDSLGVLTGDGLRAAPAVLPMLEELADESLDIDFDPAALARLDKLRAIREQVPRLPRGFATTLRDYQREGYQFLMRLAEAGLGACLADDMGLGKTVQALAVLAARAKRGPSLVVCPTSVVANWIAEAERFAPTLRCTSLGDAPDRAALLAAAGPRDVIVTSYALLTNEIEGLAELEFATVVFDEAHALKNAQTQRAGAARSIVAEFRLALTGTPIENHLGELWSLFAVIVPGLLGRESDFEERFTNVRDDRERSSRLRALLRPFVLRRLKSQVLDELPPRTEITLRIEPNAEQRAWYEAMRREALARTQAMASSKQRFQLLAEITKLRQAAVDPRLVDPGAPAGEKFGVLLERIDELRAEGHRALVFTQFLASMAAIRSGLEARGIESFHLDGSTPARQRAEMIDAFQAGEGDVFILSLRAGGVGINLTGADYVFHVDPWWNPAVEDQASDRAHRIGQRRPVTIYRLITAGTIEDKILELHASKRQLADDLLDGLERGEVLDLDQLRALLGGE